MTVVSSLAIPVAPYKTHCTNLPSKKIKKIIENFYQNSTLIKQKSNKSKMKSISIQGNINGSFNISNLRKGY